MKLAADKIHATEAPEEVPAYRLPEAARIVRLPPSTLRLWASGAKGRKPLLKPASSVPLLLSFSNLVEAFLLAAKRRHTHEQSIARIDWDRNRAVRLYPWVRGGDFANQPRTIVLDPRLGFGRPVIAATGIEARIVAERYRAGEGALRLAKDYGVEVERIEDAIRAAA